MGNKVNSSYVKKDTIVDRIDPVVKYIGVIILGGSTIIFPSPILAYILLVLLAAVAYKAEFGKEFLSFIIKFSIPILLMLILIQGFFSPQNKTIFIDFGFAILYQEGIMQAIKIVGTLLVFIGAFWLTSKTTDTSRMVSALERVGLTGYVGYLILATINVIPQMQKRMAVIKNAQNARGLETEGSLKKRVKAFLPLIGPVIMSSLMDAQERGMTLELRGFTIKNTTRVRLMEAIETTLDKRIKVSLILYFIIITMGSIALRILS
ncbi:MAG: energy-coupling factor transporter transmembrane component T [Acetivibrio sp.]